MLPLLHLAVAVAPGLAAVVRAERGSWLPAHAAAAPRHAAPRAARASAPACVRSDAEDLHVPGLNPAEYRLGTLELGDIPDCVTLLLDGFYKDMLTLAMDDFSEEEMQKLRPVLSFLNSYFSQIAKQILTVETFTRAFPRLNQAGLGPGEPLTLVLQDRQSLAVLGVVELSLQPADGKVPNDWRLPSWLSSGDEKLPYLANLVVRRDMRGNGLGSALVAAVEEVARRWGFNEIYLHAAKKEKRVLSLYADLGYKPLPAYDPPRWSLWLSGREPLVYHRKSLAVGQLDASTS